MITAVVTDIEGTTSSIAFVHEVLFPYARSHLGGFIRRHADDPQVMACLDDVRHETGTTMDLDAVIDQLGQWMAADMKITPLKTLQGLVWLEGYRNGDFKGHIYEDAWRQLVHWHQRGIRLAVYSSGSVQAQQLLFGNTEYGDLNYLFEEYFDTRIGAKTDRVSYRRIVEHLALPAGEVLFLSDVKTELDAAREAGLKTCWLVRDGGPDHAAEHLQVTDFNSIDVDKW